MIQKVTHEMPTSALESNLQPSSNARSLWLSQSITHDVISVHCRTPVPVAGKGCTGRRLFLRNMRDFTVEALVARYSMKTSLVWASETFLASFTRDIFDSIWNAFSICFVKEHTSQLLRLVVMGSRKFASAVAYFPLGPCSVVQLVFQRYNRKGVS